MERPTFPTPVTRNASVETSLHQQLKMLYAEEAGRVEVRLDTFRIDAVTETELIEIQHGSLAAIRRKIRRLLGTHRVRVVKPLIAKKTLMKRAGKNRPAVRSRVSPKRATILDLFDELIYFCDVFPHQNLVLEVPLVEVEEWRYSVSRNPRRRWRRKDEFIVEDQKLLTIVQTHEFRTCADLLALLPNNLPAPFHTGHLAALLEIPRGVAQKITYCLRHMRAITQVGKAGNALLYELAISGRTKSGSRVQAAGGQSPAEPTGREKKPARRRA